MNITLAHFELLEEIGHGGLGIVFRAFDPSLNRNVAIKVLKDEFAQDPKFVQDFLRESQNAAAISHPHIAQVHFVGEHEENYYMVMELVNGRSLEQIVKEDGPLPEAKALRVAIEITEALKAGYVNQMIHGDIKPQNIVVGEECGAKLLDFGLAQLANVEVNTADCIWGSPYYISPERVGRKAEDFRSDIYSLGATLFETLVGRPPFDAADPTELALKRLNEKPPLLRTLNPNISKRTEQIIDKMLHKNLLMRYLDYDALLKELRKAESVALGKEPLTDTMEIRRTTGHITAPVPVATSRSLLPVILAVSLISCLGVGGFFYFLISKKTPPPAVSSAPASPAEAKPAPLVSPASSVQLAEASKDAAKPTPAAQDAPGTFTVREGAFPWLRHTDWALSSVPATLIGTTPLPQQSLLDRNIKAPGSPASITLAVLNDAHNDVLRFKSAYPDAKETGEIITVKNLLTSNSHPYTVFKLAHPPENIQVQPPFSWGLILLKVETTAKSTASAPGQDASNTFMAKEGAFPWIRHTDWALSDLPPTLTGTMPLPQQSIPDRNITVPGSPASITLAVNIANNDADKFKSAYPDATETGETISLKNLLNNKSIPYKVFKLVHPPKTIQSQPPFSWGLVLLKIESAANADR